MKKKHEVKENIAVNVSVRMLNVRNFVKSSRNFNDDLLLMLYESKNENIITTRFVNAIFSLNWRKYQKRIIRIMFFPFICQLVSMINFFVYALQVDSRDRLTVAFHAKYYPLLGCCLCFILNQILCGIH